FAALLTLELREPERLRAYVALLAASGGEHDARQIRSSAEVFLGYVEVLDGRAASGLARIQHVTDDTPGAAPAPGNYAVLLRVHMQACVAAGAARTGLAAAERMLAMGEAAGLWQAEAHRMRAEFLAALG